MGDSTDMVFMRMGNDKAGEIILPLFQKRRIRQQYIHPG